jgi:hypothetical protein
MQLAAPFSWTMGILSVQSFRFWTTPVSNATRVRRPPPCDVSMVKIGIHVPSGVANGAIARETAINSSVGRSLSFPPCTLRALRAVEVEIKPTAT